MHVRPLCELSLLLGKRQCLYQDQQEQYRTQLSTAADLINALQS